MIDAPRPCSISPAPASAPAAALDSRSLAQFSFNRWPLLTLASVIVMVAVFYGWQEGQTGSADDLTRLGAKNLSLMIERGEWWRLLSANLLHASAWHLFFNALFLFNLGGPAETVFRRIDYLLLLVVSALATTLTSALLGADTSSGASGMVFGVWAALAVFGLKHRTSLPRRYQRYFLGSVIPYAAVAFFLGQKTEGADTWGHLGGLGAGLVLGFILPSRHLAPRDRGFRIKVAAVVAIAVLVAANLLVPRPAMQPSSFVRRSVATLSVPVPARWRTEIDYHEPNRDTVAFANRAHVSLAITAQKLDRILSVDEALSALVEVELRSELSVTGGRAALVKAPATLSVAGLPARRLEIESTTRGFHARAIFVVLVAGDREYVLSFSAPAWLFAAYAPTFDTIVEGILREPAG